MSVASWTNPSLFFPLSCGLMLKCFWGVIMREGRKVGRVGMSVGLVGHVHESTLSIHRHLSPLQMSRPLTGFTFIMCMAKSNIKIQLET